MPRLAESVSCPGKIFLLGEYAVLLGEPALLVAVPPRFSLRFEGEPTPFHPASPAGRLLDWAAHRGLPIPANWTFTDPLDGKGGIGASTAQFALMYKAIESDADWRKAWELYRELVPGEPGAFPPSGADLVTQWLGGVTLFDPIRRDAEQVLSRDLPGLWIFSATGQISRKVATHTHLADLRSSQDVQSQWRAAMSPAFVAGLEALRRDDMPALGRALTEFGDALRSLGLEVDATRADREAFAALPGVLGTKGAGAMQADAIVVLVDPAQVDRNRLLSIARERGLRLVVGGLHLEKGIEEKK